MTNADTQVGPGSQVAAVLTGAGLRLEPGVADGAGLAAVAGPLLSADIVDASGGRVATVAVLDDPESEPDVLLQAMVEAAMADAGPGAAPQAADPVGTAPELTARYSMPVSVAAFSDGSRVRAVHLSAAGRRAEDPGAGSAAGAANQAAVGAAMGSLDKLINVALDVSVELGRTKVTLAEVLDYDVGSVVELDRAAGAPVDIRVNDTLLAQGEVVLIDDEYAVRITQIFDPKSS